MPRYLTREELDNRSLAILECMASGYTNKEIADELEMSIETVRKFIQTKIQPSLGIFHDAEDNVNRSAATRCKTVAEAFRQGIL